ncbi:fibronectin type III domain-containing protein [Acidovorax sp.]|uniref:RCC1 domain-containing protein n=1 Tax=Acidovorax sp. TaxID=1872122 RepID=UPI002ACEEDE2|nr:fibronectin type III domain-containing protein [Acidovorax sp.]MDZ7863975.1 fibronectin type III domain-containing protein [Acidovorax sp.]
MLPAQAQAPVPAAVLGEPVQQLSQGERHSCALTAAGRVFCWGSNFFGQLGDGSTTNTSTPQPVTGLSSGVAAIAAGFEHTCALTTAGAMLCWGANTYGQLGDGSTTHKTAPQPVTALASGVAAIAAGFQHTCAVTTAGAVYCWGLNDNGQLGDGSTTDKSTPQPVTGLASGGAALSAGNYHTCVLTVAGAVQCWGINALGQLGDGSNAGKTTPQPVTGLASGVVAISTGARGNHTCAVTTAGAMQCWGLGIHGQLGDGTLVGKTTPQPVTGLASGVASIAAGEHHTCAVTTAGAVQCWGDNPFGQLGDGSTTNKSTPQPVTGLASGVAAIAVGSYHTCALSTGGTAQCWGRAIEGQLGNGSTTDKTTPQPVAILASGAAAVVPGFGHSCALTTAGAVQCWGYNASGQLGDGSTTNKSTPQPVTGLASGVAAIAAGYDHTCALTMAGAVKCWGANPFGQLGDGGTTSKSTPQPVPGLASGVASIAAGDYHTCALTTAGAVYCWGRNTYGNLGDGSTTNKSTPQAVTGMASGVAAMAPGSEHTCAVTTAGAVQCWGRNQFGQLGDGSTTYKSTPQPVTGLASGGAAIVAGYSHTCALTTAGAVRCWGANPFGQLGDGSTTNKSTPQPVTGLAGGVAAIAGRNGHTCALTTAGAVQCWGRNNEGQLGEGSTTDQSTPQPVTGLASGVAAIAAGGNHTCALATAEAVQCWGNNSSGQLGNGSWASRSVPTRIAAAQAIDYPVAVGSPAPGAPTTLAATASSGLAVAFDTFTPDVCTVTGTALTVLPGKGGYLCGVLARQSGGAGADAAYFAEAPTRSRLLLVPPGVPDAPTAVTATAGNAQATVVWTPPASNGGSAITAYTVAAVADPTKTCTVNTGSPLPTTCTVLGLANGTAYTFAVKATNGVGDSVASAASAAATPATQPDAPTAVTATAGDSQALVTWAAPASNGGSAITAYTVAAVANPAKTCTVNTGSPLPTTCTVMGLANGTAYTFAVKATNGAGDSVASAASAPVTPTAPAGGGAPTSVNVNSAGTTTITDPTLPIVVGPGAVGATLVVPGTGTTPVTLQINVNGQPLSVQALPGTQLKTTQANGQTVLVLVVQHGWASMTSTAAGQPLVLAGDVLLSSGMAGTTIEAQPLTVAVLVGALVPPAGSLPQVGRLGLLAGEKLQVNERGALIAVTLGSLKGDTTQPGDAMAFANLPASITVDDKAFARLAGPLARLSGASLAQGLETAPSGVVLVRNGAQIYQLLPVLPIAIDATLPDGLAFTPLGLLRWVRGGVVVQFAPAVADLAGLASAVAAALPGAQLRLGAEGVLQLTTGGQTYVLRPDWTGSGTATGTATLGVDEQGRIVFQIGQGARQLLLPALLNIAQANAIFTAALPGASLAVQPSASDGALTLTLGGQGWRLVPQWVLPAGDAGQTEPWRIGGDGLLYLKLETQVQGVRVVN